MYWDSGRSVWLNGAFKHGDNVPGRWSQCLAEWGIKTSTVSVLRRWSQCLAQWGINTPRVSVLRRWSQCLAEWGIKTPTVSVLAGTAVVMQRLAKCDNRTLESMSGQ